MTRVCENILIALVGDNAPDSTREVSFHRNWENTEYFEISMKLMQNLNEPFLWLARELTGENDLHFVDPPAPFHEDFDDDDHDDERDSSDVLMTFLDSEKESLKCAPSNFFDWLTGEDIATIADLLVAIRDVDYQEQRAN